MVAVHYTTTVLRRLHSRFNARAINGLMATQSQVHPKGPCRVGSVGSVSASGTVDREFASRPGHTKDIKALLTNQSQVHPKGVTKTQVRGAKSHIDKHWNRTVGPADVG